MYESEKAVPLKCCAIYVCVPIRVRERIGENYQTTSSIYLALN